MEHDAMGNGKNNSKVSELLISLTQLENYLSDKSLNTPELKGKFERIYSFLNAIDDEFADIITEKNNNEKALRESADSMKDINDYLKTVTDQLEKAKEQALASSRAKSAFLNNISHEIRTPMNAILGYTRQLRITEDPKKREEFFEIIENNGESLMMLVNDVIDISKLEVNKIKLLDRPLILNTFLEELSWVFKVRAGEKNIDYITNIDENLPRCIEVDKGRLRQVLYNILGNAIKFTDEGFVSLVVYEEGEVNYPGTCNIAFEIEDSGIGVKKEEVERIFEPFEQQTGQDVGYGGSGLGLSISKKIVELMGGAIEWVEKKTKGTIFRVVLNNVKTVSGQQADNIERQLTGQTNVDFGGAKILLVEDDLVNRRLIKEYLETMNVEITEANNGKECMDILQTLKPDVILMDIRMPVMDGMVATRIIKSEDKTKDIPVVILSATAVLGDENIETIDYNSVIIKPVQKEELIGELQKYIKGRS
jgi:two-component system, NarL family, sensor histidine kinase EvgS